MQRCGGFVRIGIQWTRRAEKYINIGRNEIEWKRRLKIEGEIYYQSYISPHLIITQVATEARGNGRLVFD